MGSSSTLVPVATLAGLPCEKLGGGLWPRFEPAASRVQRATLAKMAFAGIGATEGNSGLARFLRLPCVKACTRSQAHHLPSQQGENAAHVPAPLRACVPRL